MRVALDLVFFAVCLILIVLLAAAPSRAQTPCAGLTATLEALAVRWSERPLWTGHLTDGRRIMVLAAPDGGTWTTLLIRPDGIACTIAAGSGWDPGGGPPAGVRG